MIDGERSMTQLVAESTTALITTVPPVGGRSGGDTESCWIEGFGSGATVTVAELVVDPPEPVAVTVKRNEFSAAPMLEGTATAVVKVPVLHGTSIGNEARSGDTDTVQDGCCVTDPVSSTVPPVAGSSDGDARNELITGADDESTVTVAFDVAVPPAPVAVTVTAYVPADVVALEGNTTLSVATPPEQSVVAGSPEMAGVAVKLQDVAPITLVVSVTGPPVGGKIEGDAENVWIVTAAGDDVPADTAATVFPEGNGTATMSDAIRLQARIGVMRMPRRG